MGVTSFLISATGPQQTADQTGGYEWRQTMATLWQLLRRSMADAEVQERRLYPVNFDKHVLRPVPFVWALARELATAYVHEPSRRWVDLDGNPLSDEVQAMIAREYKRARVNRIMRNAHRQLVALNNSTIWVWPDKASSGVRLRFIPPHEQEVQLRPFATAEDDVEYWRFRVPMPMPQDPQTFMGAVGVVSVDRTDDEGNVVAGRAVWESAPGKLTGRGLYEQDGSNPFGLIPVVMLRGSEPGEGEWWAPAPDDILSASRAMAHDLTDVGTIARLQGFGQPVMKTNNLKDAEQRTGPETAVAVPTDGDYYFAQAKPELAAYVEQNREFVETVVGMNGLRSSTFTKGITAVAKATELTDRDEVYRQEHTEILRDSEQRLYDVMRAVINWQRGGQEVWPAARVEVEYHEPVVAADPLHEAQGLALLIALKQTDYRKARAKRDGVSVEEAASRILEEEAWRKEHGFDVPTAGGTTPMPESGEKTETPAPEDGEDNDGFGAPAAGDEGAEATA